MAVALVNKKCLNHGPCMTATHTEVPSLPTLIDSRLELSFSKGRMWIQFLPKAYILVNLNSWAASKLQYLYWKSGGQPGRGVLKFGKGWRSVWFRGLISESQPHGFLRASSKSLHFSDLNDLIMELSWGCYAIWCSVEAQSTSSVSPFWESTFYGSLSFGHLSSSHWALPPYSTPEGLFLSQNSKSEHCLPGRIQNFVSQDPAFVPGVLFMRFVGVFVDKTEPICACRVSSLRQFCPHVSFLPAKGLLPLGLYETSSEFLGIFPKPTIRLNYISACPCFSCGTESVAFIFVSALMPGSTLCIKL